MDTIFGPEGLTPREQDCRTAVQETWHARYIEMFGIHPTLSVESRPDSEIFKMSEFIAGRITTIFVRVGTLLPRYFSLRDDYRLSYDEILARVNEFIVSKANAVLPSSVLSTVVVDTWGWATAPVAAWAELVADFRGVNGHNLVMLSQNLLQRKQDGPQVSVPDNIAAELVPLDPHYLIVNYRDASSVAGMARMMDVPWVRGLQRPSRTEATNWQWIEKHAVMANVRNGQTGVWDFVLSTWSMTEVDVPPLIKAKLHEAAFDLEANFLLFHQGS